MKIKSVLKKIIAISLVAGAMVSSLALAGCNDSDKIGYVVIEQKGHYVLHTYKHANSYSDSYRFETTCCDNVLFVGTDNCIVYHDKKPSQEFYDKTCKELTLN